MRVLVEIGYDKYWKKFSFSFSFLNKKQKQAFYLTRQMLRQKEIWDEVAKKLAEQSLTKKA